jgi:hypothetical protein
VAYGGLVLGLVGRIMGLGGVRDGSPVGSCFVCHGAVRSRQPRLRVRNGVVHERCATYRMRQERGPAGYRVV